MLRDLRLSLSLVAAAAVACSGGGGGNSSTLSISPSPSSAPADGMSTITLTLIAVGADGNPYNGTVNLTSKKLVSYGDGDIQNTTVAMIKGAASETIDCDSSNGCAGGVTINGSLISNGANASAQTQVTFTAIPPNPDAGDGGADGGDAGSTTDGGADGGTADGGDAGPPPVPGQIIFVKSAAPYMGVDYGPTGVSQLTIDSFTFEVADTTGKTPIPGVPVTFSSTSDDLPQGTYLVDGGVTDAGLQLVHGITDMTGSVVVQAHSGQRSGPVTINASIDNTSFPAAEATSSVVGTQPSVTNSSVSCSPENLPVYLGNQGKYPLRDLLVSSSEIRLHRKSG